MASNYGRSKNPVQYGVAHELLARQALEDCARFFAGHRVMSEALGSSYEYLSQCWDWRVPGPEVLDKLTRMSQLAQSLLALQPDPVQLGWWLACRHLSLHDPDGGQHTCPGRLIMRHPQLIDQVRAAAKDDFRDGSKRHRRDLTAIGYQPPAQPSRDPRSATRETPWFILRPKTRRSLWDEMSRRGVILAPASAKATPEQSSLAELLQETLA